jgi:hypothetical protein
MDVQVETACNALMKDGAMTRSEAWNSLKADPRFKEYFTQPQPETTA